MTLSRPLVTLLVCGVLSAFGCSRSNDAELAQLRAEVESARADAAEARREAEAAKQNPPKTSTDLRVWRDAETEELCNRWLGVEAYCFKFEGGWVDFWIDFDGSQRVIDSNPQGMKKSLDGVREGAVGRASGSFLWIRQTSGEGKNEQVAFRGTLTFPSIQPDWSANQVSMSALTTGMRLGLKGGERVDRRLGVCPSNPVVSFR